MSLANILEANNYALYAKNLPVLKSAAVQFVGASGAVTYKNSGVTSVTRGGAGVYAVDYTAAAFLNANVYVQITLLHATGLLAVVQATPSATTCFIKCYAADGTTAADPAAIIVNIFGN